MADDTSFADLVRRGEAPLPGEHTAPRRAAVSHTATLLPPDSDRPLDNVPDVHRANGIGERDLQKMRRATPEAELDLHGLTIEEAYTTLDNFLQGAQARHCKTVEIIHGRGLHGDGGGILRAKTRQWLLGSPAVLAYVEPPKNSGAVIVLLRQPRRPRQKP